MVKKIKREVREIRRAFHLTERKGIVIRDLNRKVRS
jgi:hypothetical protein